MASNLTAVLFTLALIYSGLLWLAVAHTYKKMFRGGPQTENQRSFKIFYGFLWATLALTIILYLILSTELFKIEDITDSSKRIYIGVVVFYFLPTVFMVLCFSLMYYQLELLMTESRISGGQEMRSRLKNKKLAVIMRVMVYTCMTVFVITQLVIMALALFGLVNLQMFVKQCWIFTLIIIVFLNVYLVHIHFKLAGRPFKNDKLQQNLAHIRMVVILWNLGFIIKFSFITAGKSIFDLDKQDNIDAYSSCLFGGCDFFSLVIPFYCVTNAKFVKIFGFKAFERGKDTVVLEQHSVIDV